MKIHSLSVLNSLIGSLIDSLPKENWIVCDNPIDQIVSDGFVKKFEATESDLQDVLHNQCASAWLEYDDTLPAEIEEISFSTINETELVSELERRLRGFHISFEDGWVGPGETFHSAHGWVDASSKLSASKWTVTPNCLDLFEEWVLGHRGLRRLIAESRLEDQVSAARIVQAAGLKFEIPAVEFDVRRATYENYVSRKEWPGGPYPCAPRDRFIFRRELFFLKLQMRMEVVHGNRFTSVPKNNTKRRPICVEPLGNSICQKMVGAGLRRVLLKHSIDIENGQQQHYELIGSMRYATLDLSNASDSISMALCRRLLPDFFVRLLEKTRSPYSLTDEGWIPVRKVASMGCGFTFELMTFLLHTALCVGLRTDDVKVYGDDILVPLDQYEAALAIVTDLGFTVNADKSCGDGIRAESCGAFVVRGEYVTRFDFKRIEDLQDLIIFGNKVGRLLQADQTSYRVRLILQEMELLLRDQIPVGFHGPRSPGGLPLWYETDCVMEKTPIERFVSQTLYGDVRLVKACIKRTRAENFRPNRVDVMVSLKSGRTARRFNRRRTILETVSLLTLNGYPLMTRGQWNDREKTGFFSEISDLGLYVKT